VKQREDALPIRRRLAAEHGADHGQRQRKPTALRKQQIHLARQFA
jgi:hypothetical protein